MKLQELNERPVIEVIPKLNQKYIQFSSLLQELNEKEISVEIIDAINIHIERVNEVPDNELKKQLRKSQWAILKLIEKELKLVAVHHYRNMWMALGMSMFGVPFGVVIGLSLGSMAFLGIGIPIGMVIGMAMGSQMDAKAKKEGRQLNIVLK